VKVNRKITSVLNQSSTLINDVVGNTFLAECAFILVYTFILVEDNTSYLEPLNHYSYIRTSTNISKVCL